MAAKLKNLRIRKVDFVESGANPRADIKIFKKKDGQGTEAALKRLAAAVEKLFGNAGEDREEPEKDMREPMRRRAPESFGEGQTKDQYQRAADEMWNICWELQSALYSVLRGGDGDKRAAQREAEACLSKFSEIAREAFGCWLDGRPGGAEAELGQADAEALKEFRDYLDQKIKSCGNGGEEGEREPADTGPDSKKVKEEEAMQEGAIYKGLPPAAEAEIRALRKFRRDTETKELLELAKRYEFTGKKPEDLAAMLREIKAADRSAYEAVITILNSMMSVAENCGAFSEIGKSGYSGHADAEGSKAELQAASIAREYMKKEPSMSYTDAVARAWENNPDLMASYEDETKF